MKKVVVMTLLSLMLFAGSAFAEDVKVCEGTASDPRLSSCGPGMNFGNSVKEGYRLISVVFANGRFYFYLVK